VREQVIPEAMRLAGEREFYTAFVLAREAEQVLGEDPQVATLWREVAVEVPLHVEPSGADLYVRDYRDPESQWIHLGTSPSHKVRVPDGFNRFRLERPGYDTVEKAMSAVWFVEFTAGLDETGAAPPGMLRIPSARFGGWANNLNLSRYEHPANPRVGEFLIDRYEVTNASYQRFVDAGGYSNPECWKHAFRRDGVTLTWEAAISEFVDETGRPGPATWAYGTFPEGRADYPVTGVSWYEAAAYAEFSGKELPTVYHWAVGTNVYYGEFLIPLSNLEGSGLAPVGSFTGSLDSNGLYDTPGNAREWCFNASGEDRFILGGAWNDPVYRFGQGVARAPLERSPGNGFRCMIVRSRDASDPRLWGPLPRIAPLDWSAVEHYSDAVWGTWVSLLALDDRPLDSRIERVDDTPPHWRLEKVSFVPAYDGERMLAYLLLPRNTEPPYDAVLFYNGGAFGLGSSRNGQGLVCMDKIDYIVRAGRAAVYPVYYGSFERGGGGPPRTLSEAETLEIGIRLYKDLIRTLDYLESRDDIDVDRLAYISFSAGAFPGLVASVLDDRISTLILKSPNIGHEFTYNSALRATAPVLMVTGRYDEHDTNETVQLPLFNALATPPEHKRQVVLECHHGLYPCRREMIPEVLAWLDRYLGPVARPTPGAGG
jgi:formylglycine-generating enzyme required for sulfatase activity/dienelactone hydrolase